jgi:cobalamin biosynthesis Co2+ chelatase CbiK
MLTLFTVSCCTYYSDKEFTDYYLNKDSFDKTHIKILEKRTGLKFPRGTKGLNLFNNGNKIDPSVYAKLEIPKVEVDNIVSQLETHKRAYDTITYGGKPKLNWWTPSDKMRMNDNYDHFADRNNFLTIYIFCRENKHWILYLDIGI